MRFLHCSDLHIGRKLHGYSMIDDQRHILGEMCRIAREKEVDAILVAGDVYDTTIPNEDAVNLLDEFLTEAVSICPVYVVAGNHDSVERLSFMKTLLGRQNVFVTGRYDGRAEKFTVEDAEGKLNIFLLPYTKTSVVRTWCRRNGLDADAIETPDAAFSLTLGRSEIEPSERNVLVAHEFVAGKGIQLEKSDSEISSLDPVGGADCISYELLAPFDYVALGHIHRPQRAGRDTVLYCGSPLKYSASEIKDEKHAVIVDVRGKGDVSVETVPLVPKRRMVRLHGTVEEMLAQSDSYRDEYVVAELTERADNPSDRLSEVFRLVELKRLYEVQREEGVGESTTLEEIRTTSPQELFARFYQEMKGEALSRNQMRVIEEITDEAGRCQ